MKRNFLLYSGNPDYDYTDSFEYTLHDPDDQIDLFDIAETFAGPSPKWVEALLSLRNRIVAVFGLKTGMPPAPPDRTDPHRWDAGQHAGIFTIFAHTDDEMLLGEDDKHLDFRVSLFVERCGAAKKVTVTTAVRYNNRLGRCYFFVIKPFHKIIVPTTMKRNFRRLETACYPHESC